MKDSCWTVGPCDAVVVTEAPDDETAAAALTVGGLGNVRTTAPRAFSGQEFAVIAGRAG